jgi:uncharacterized protein with FMN-binding domain
MAVTYHGSTSLINTGAQYTEFPSGLVRLDATYVCRTTQASAVSSQLDAKTPLPSFTSFTSQFAATREYRSDGFTYFSATGYKGNAAVSRTVLGAVVSNLTIPCEFTSFTDQISRTSSVGLPATIISDTITKIYTIATSSSNAAIAATPPSTLSIRIIKSPAIPTGWTVPVPFATYIAGSKDIINIDRTNYGAIDEVTVTYGFIFTFSTPFVAYIVNTPAA